jgi:hypothetical protein
MYAMFCSIAIHIDSEIVVPLPSFAFEPTIYLLRRCGITASATWLPASLALTQTSCRMCATGVGMYASYRSRPLCSLSLRSLLTG